MLNPSSWIRPKAYLLLDSFSAVTSQVLGGNTQARDEGSDNLLVFVREMLDAFSPEEIVLLAFLT